MIITISIDEIPTIMINTSGPVDGSSESHSHLLSNKTNTTKAVSNKVDNVHTTLNDYVKMLSSLSFSELWDVNWWQWCWWACWQWQPLVVNVNEETRCQVPCETPDIVSSCDSGEGSKRNSLELDTESFGILRLEKGNLLRERSWKRAM